jgi:hypothetical protein
MRKGLIIILLLIGSAMYAAAQQSPPCSLANIAGDWAFRNNGKTPNGDFNGIGTIHIAKDGAITGRGWITVGGVVSSEVPLSGTTTVTANCISTGTFEGTPPFHCVILANRTKMWCVYEAPQDTTVILEKIGRP